MNMKKGKYHFSKRRCWRILLLSGLILLLFSFCNSLWAQNNIGSPASSGAGSSNSVSNLQREIENTLEQLNTLTQTQTTLQSEREEVLDTLNVLGTQMKKLPDHEGAKKKITESFKQGQQKLDKKNQQINKVRSQISQLKGKLKKYQRAAVQAKAIAGEQASQPTNLGSLPTSGGGEPPGVSP
jgi:septal ring factor EnvC (AmiA/AmiB activator)